MSVDASTQEAGAAARQDDGVAAVRLAIRVLQLGPVLILIAVVAGFAMLSPLFLTERNVINIGVQSSPIVALALGQMIVIIARGIDLSIGSTVSLSTVAGALAYTSGASDIVSIALFIAPGVAVGLVNGLVYVRGGIPNPFIVTLAMLYLVSGLALILSNGDSIIGTPPLVQSVGNDDIWFLPAAIVAVVVLAGLVALVMHATRFGRWVYAIGGNPVGAERVGIPVGAVLISTYVASGVCAGIAGLIIAGRTDTGYPTAGQGLELDVIAAVIIGGTSIFGGRGTVVGVVIGALLLGVIRNGLNVLSVSTFWQVAVIGAIILLAVGLDVGRQRLETRFQSMQAARMSTS